jgi:predicted Zn-dependent protease
LAQLPLEVFQAGYSKDQELEADREGARLAVRAGYSPEGAIRLFGALQRLRGLHDRPARTPQEEVAKVAAQALSEYFQSHPLESDRIAQMRSLIAREHWENIRERPLETIARTTEPRREPADNAPPRILR